jgi:hypothetical protein
MSLINVAAEQRMLVAGHSCLWLVAAKRRTKWTVHFLAA